MWYRVVRAAKYLGVAPWDLSERPQFWLSVAEEAQASEATASRARQQRSNVRGGGIRGASRFR